MKINRHQQGRMGSLPGLLVVTLLAISAISFASTFRAASNKVQRDILALPSAAEPDRSNLPASEPDDLTPPTLGNYPDASIALSANTTVTPDATPTNTTGISVFSSTSFKGKLEGDPGTGVVRVTDAHPAGTHTVTVRAFNRNGPSTTRTFTLTVSTTMCLPMFFTGPTNFGIGTGASPNLVVVGDFNGDGKQDLVTSNTGFTGGVQANVSILLGDGTGGFNGVTNFAAGISPYSVVVVDFNGDGKEDLAVANSIDGTVSILLGAGGGQFNPPTSFDVGSYPYAVVTGDFNGDGRPDLVAINSVSFDVSVLLGDGTGSFSAPTNFPVGRYPYWGTVGDFNADGRQDLVVANSDSDTVSVLLGDGTGSFSAAVNFGVSHIPEQVAVGDFNGDGNQDLAVANTGGNSISILLGNGMGNFGSRTDFYSGGNSPKSVAIGDFNGDGNQDVAVVNYQSNRLTLLFGNGTGSFGSPTNFGVGNASDAVAVGDFNGDGRQDLAVSNGATNSVSIIMRQQCPVPTPTATASATASPTATATATGTQGPIPSLGNYPNTSIPLSTNTTVVPDATPANTTRIDVSTSTTFQGRLDADPITGVVRVTDAHPAETYTVTVQAFNGGGSATTTRTFTLTVTTPATCSPLSFTAVNFCAGDFNASTAIVGDFNGDGKQDVATAYYESAGYVSVLLGDGVGHFGAPNNISVGAFPYAPAVGDFNGDGKQDLVVPTNPGVRVLLGDGTGHFTLLPTFGPSSDSVAVSDFNGDGKKDIASNNRGSANVSIFLGDGAGGFSGPTIFGVGISGGPLALGDFNSDGKQDLAVISNADGVSILFGDGAGGFSVPIHYAAVSSPSSVKVGDFNGDGKQDLVINSYGSSTIAILLGDGTGFFSVLTTFQGNAPHLLEIGDFNGDGKQDLTVANYGGSGVSIYLGDGTGHFGAGTNFQSGHDSYSVAVGDFNGDGMQDIVVGQFGATIGILFRTCPGGTPTPSPTPTATGTPPPPPTLGNYPNKSIPLSTDTIVSPDAAPSNTTSINVSAPTNFHGTLEGDPITGAIRVTNAHPAGTYLVTVKALNADPAIATKTFTLTVTTPATCNPVSFATGSLNFGFASESVGVGDFNGDGKQDLVAASNSSGSVTVLLGDGAGNFDAGIASPVGLPLLSIAVADFNGDGKQDIVTTNNGSCSGTISILLGDGAAHFGSPATFNSTANIFPYGVAVGDFNGDGKQDIVTANNASSNLSVFLGNGDGSLRFPTNISAGSNPNALVVGDFNSDGKQDIAVANYGSSNVSISLGDGAGNFSAPTNIAAASFPYSISLADFNNDGKQDLAVANRASNNVSILLGDGMGHFASPNNFLVDCGPYLVVAGDFDGDGKQDLAVTSNGCNGTSHMMILLGDGAGNFTGPTAFASGNNIRSVAVGDFNSDGKQDVALSNYGSTAGSVLLRSCVPPPTATPSATATVSPCPPVITQSSSQAITTTLDPCRYGPTGSFRQTQNSYWRAFNMASFTGAQYNVTSVSFGIYAVGYNTPPSLIVRLYRNSGAPFPGGTRTVIGSSTTLVASGQGGTVVTVPLQATVPAGTSELVMELDTPDGLANGYVFNVGANGAPETGPSYWSCVGSTPQVVGIHLVFNIYGNCTAIIPTPTPTPTLSPTPTPTPCLVLYDQSDSAGGGAVVSQNFETANNNFDAQAADDFVVPTNQNWQVQQVKVNGRYFNGPGPATSANVTFYFDAANFPGAAVAGGSFNNLTISDASGNFTIPLLTNLVLTAGTYWISVQPNLDFNPYGEWAWNDRTVTSNSAAVWQNPGGGFATSCSVYGRRGANCGIDPTAPDQIFQILGCPATGTPINISGAVAYCSNPSPSAVANVALILSGSAAGMSSSDSSGNYLFSVPSGGNYTITPNKSPLAAGAPGITTTDVVAVQRHFLTLGTPLSGCRLTAADVNGDTAINTVDVVAIQRFFLALSTGTANTGRYQFNPVNRTYSGVITNQINQNYDAFVLGDVASPFVH